MQAESEKKSYPSWIGISSSDGDFLVQVGLVLQSTFNEDSFFMSWSIKRKVRKCEEMTNTSPTWIGIASHR